MNENLENLRAQGAARAKAEADGLAALAGLTTETLEELDAPLELAVETDEVLEEPAPEEVEALVAEPAAPVLDEIEEAILAELGAAQDTSVVEEIVASAAPSKITRPADDFEIDELVMDDSVMNALAQKLEQSEAYESQTTSVNMSSSAAAAAALSKGPRAVKAPRAPKAPKAAGSAPIVRDLSAVPDKLFALHGSVSAVESMSAADLATERAKTLSGVPGQVKVVEKFENIFIALNAGRLPYNYTVTTFKLLDAKGTVTSAEIVAALQAAGAGEGTARSQCGQMMALLPALDVAERNKSTLTLRPDSTIAERLRGLIAAAGK